MSDNEKQNKDGERSEKVPPANPPMQDLNEDFDDLDLGLEDIESRLPYGSEDIADK